MSITSTLTDFTNAVRNKLTLPLNSQNRRLQRTGGVWTPKPIVNELSIVDEIYKLDIARDYSTSYPVYDIKTGLLWTHNGTSWVSQSLTIGDLISTGVVVNNHLVLSPFEGKYYFLENNTLNGVNTTAPSIEAPPSGYDWVTRNGGTTQTWTDITYGNGVFIGVAFNSTGGSRIIRSVDGINWSQQSAPVVAAWDTVTYGNGLFVALSGSIVITSPDGITWTQRTGHSGNWKVCYGNGLFVAVSGSTSGNQVITSPDGINWTVRTAPAAPWWNSITYGNGRFVAAANGGSGDRVMSSPDGINWTSHVIAGNPPWGAVIFGKNTFILVSSDSGINYVMLSVDGINWSQQAAGINVRAHQGAFGNNIFISIYGATVFISEDGLSWETRTIPNSFAGVCIAYGEGIFAALASNGTSRIATSP